MALALYDSITDKKAVPFGEVQSSGPINASVSRDGRWVTYASYDV